MFGTSNREFESLHRVCACSDLFLFADNHIWGRKLGCPIGAYSVCCMREMVCDVHLYVCMYVCMYVCADHHVEGRIRGCSIDACVGCCDCEEVQVAHL